MQYCSLPFTIMVLMQDLCSVLARVDTRVLMLCVRHIIRVYVTLRPSPGRSSFDRRCGGTAESSQLSGSLSAHMLLEIASSLSNVNCSAACCAHALSAEMELQDSPYRLASYEFKRVTLDGHQVPVHVVTKPNADAVAKCCVDVDYADVYLTCSVKQAPACLWKLLVHRGVREGIGQLVEDKVWVIAIVFLIEWFMKLSSRHHDLVGTPDLVPAALQHAAG